ncbi:hypothetical protein [Endozoicomonas sp. ONNA2]|nr:hypothetical protein [Endozoicomonas sp. ONNA2]
MSVCTFSDKKTQTTELPDTRTLAGALHNMAVSKQLEKGKQT